MKISVLTFLLCYSFFSNCQAVDYDDVAVIVNDNSQTSIDIGNYFQTARNIPNQNMIHVSAPTTEAIDSTQFELIRTQIENYLINNNLADSINYLVTTKGVPLKVDGSCFNTPQSSLSCASFDSELCLILGPYANQIGEGGSYSNPFQNSSENFSRDSTGIYLVTRLSGYTEQDVYNLIDRSGPITGVNQMNAQVVLDLNNAPGMDSNYFSDLYINPTDSYLTTFSWNSQVDFNQVPLLNQTNVFGYVFYGSGPISNVSLNYNWTAGSIGMNEAPFGAETFDLTQNTSNAFLIADLISEGCTGAHGIVNGNFFSLVMNSETVLESYLDPLEFYNLAESFYMAEPRLSWQAVIIGDPKASIQIDNTAFIEEPEELSFSIYPNPTQGNVTVESSEAISSVQIYALSGALVRSIDIDSKTKVNLDLEGLDAGVYLAHISSEGNINLERIVLTR